MPMLSKSNTGQAAILSFLCCLRHPAAKQTSRSDDPLRPLQSDWSTFIGATVASDGGRERY
jgi:hypothetical protein